LPLFARAGIAQVGAGCYAEALTRRADVRADGSFTLFNVPAGVFYFQTLVTCPQDGLQGQSPLVFVNDGETIAVTISEFEDTARVPGSLTLQAPVRTLSRLGDRVFTRVIADFADGTRRNLTYPSLGTTYRSSNPQVASVDATGCVIAEGPGTAVISALNSGRTATARFLVTATGPDTDGDGMSDECEAVNGFDALDARDGAEDADGDELINRDECINGTNPRNPDSDGDGLDDGAEIAAETDPLNSDTDGDGLPDGDEVQRGTNPLSLNSDTGCLPDGLEVALGLNPLNPGDDQGDPDADGLLSCDEFQRGTDPGSPDTDGDGITDGEELVAGTDGFVTDPLKPDTDGDGYSDGLEVGFGSDPSNRASTPTGDIIIQGRTVTLGGTVTMRSLTLRNGAVLTIPAPTSTSVSRLDLDVGTLTIDANSRIDATGRGYLGGRTGGNTGDVGRTTGNSIAGGSDARNGGSYAGLGAFGNNGGITGYAYGNVREPNEPGGGGGTNCGGGSNNGGGLIRIKATTVQVDGQIVADGGSNPGNGCAGGGSGGGIYVSTDTLRGSGSVHANGGDASGFSAGGGGGGRIALHYQTATGFDFSRVQALGGVGQSQGSPGTVYLQGPTEPFGRLVIDAGERSPSRNTPLLSVRGGVSTKVGANRLTDSAAAFVPGMLAGLELNPNTAETRTFTILANDAQSITTDPADGDLGTVAAVGASYEVVLRVDRLRISNRARLDVFDANQSLADRRGVLRAGNIDIVNTSRLMHPPATLASHFGVELRIDDALAVDETSRIDVTELGFLGGRTRENSNDAGRAADNDIRGASDARNGGTHAGLGAFGNNGGMTGTQYGDPRDPDEPGAGGGTNCGAGFNSGGGLIRIAARSLDLDGEIVADGGSNPGNGCTGGGAGGSVRMDVGTLSGSGKVKANAGIASGFSGGGGGGGRVAIYYEDASGFDLTRVESFGGGGQSAGGPGTIFLKQGDQLGELIVRGGGRETPLPEDFASDHVTLDGALVSVTRSRPTNLALRNSAVLTHEGGGSFNSRLDLRVTQLSIEEMSRIDVSARGFLGGRTGENGADPGRTLGNTTLGGSTARNGGSYGGLGANGNQGGEVNSFYGDPRDPNELGSGGGTNCGGGSNSGGGLLRVVADSVVLGGEILANGGSNPGNGCAGGGSGGGVRIDTRAIAGTGHIRANGGVASGFSAGGGGGGRVALYYTSATDFDPSADIETLGGGGQTQGAPGTVYYKQAGQLGELIVRGTGRETPLTEGYGTDRLTLDAANVSVQQISPTNLAMRNGAILTHPAATSTSAGKLEITVNELDVDASSRIDVTGRGFLGGRTGSNTADVGRTLGNTTEGGSTARNGGTHAGLGAFGNVGGSTAVQYGDFRNPNELGGGGGTDCGGGSNSGGGLLRINAQSIQLSGQIVADGAGNPGNGCAGGGGGGGVRIDTQTLGGSGVIRANGGAASGFSGGGGGGGRIAIFYANPGFNFANVSAFGGVGQSQGGPGTVFLKRTGQPGDLIVRGAGRESPLPENFSSDRLTLDGSRMSVSKIDPLTLTLVGGAVLTHPPGTLMTSSRLDISADALSIDETSSIDVTARGFVGGRTLDNAENSGHTLGNLSASGSNERNGGSYGGLGAFGNNGGVVASSYGSFRDPDELGSGGGTNCGGGFNSGGGLVRIVADEIDLDGLIVADGGSNAGNGCAGGGSGGGVKLDVGTVSGSGMVRADGGAASGFSAGGGGGGRISVLYADAAEFDFANVRALGGAGQNNGSPGTIFLQADGQQRGELIIDAGGRGPSRATQLLSLESGASTAIAVNSLADGSASFVPGQLIGLELNPNTAQSRTFTVIANDQTTLQTDPADGDVRSVAAVGNTYSARIDLDRFTLTNRAVAEILDGNQSHADRRGRLSATNVDITAAARLTHPPADIVSFFGLELNVPANLFVENLSAIDVVGKGFLGGRTGANAENNGRTLGNTTAGGSTGRNGGSHGGLGGIGNTGGTVNAVYGNANDPNQPGSGGGTDCGGGSNSGGGLVRINTGAVQLDGTITADGAANPGNGCAGGGSGGGIRLNAGTLAGAGTVTANGGSASGFSAGGGGGGRVAVFFDALSGFSGANVQANGGPGQQSGGAGTVVFE
jgi:hypothetical protein